MTRIVIAATADADTDAILTSLAARAGRRTAARYHDLFERLYDHLTYHPASLPRRPALGSRIRIGIVAPFIVIYEYDEANDTVTVLRIVHGRRKITGRMLSEFP
jgi:toxin ParE1/3/4